MKFWWVKERHNPQLGVYYVGCGQLSKRAARIMEDGCLYGDNIMHKYATAEEYNSRLAEIEKERKKAKS